MRKTVQNSPPVDSQIQGPVGRFVAGMIRRTVRARFRALLWFRPADPPPFPSIFVTSHHGWHDGYVMFHVLERLGHPFYDWVQEFDAFPAFRFVGGLPFPVGDPARRAASVRTAVRALRERRRSLLLFAEGVLHPPPDLLPFGRSLEVVARQAPEAAIIPVGLRYEMALHERPEALIALGPPIAAGDGLLERARDAVAEQLQRLAQASREDLEVLTWGTKDVNERLDMRKFRKGSS